MSFDTLFMLNALLLITGVLATIVFYVRLCIVSPKTEGPPLLQYFGYAILCAIVAFAAGTMAGIFFACNASNPGNLCGL